MNFLISGAGGLIGKALENFLSKKGHTVYPLVRAPQANTPFYWQPTQNIIHLDDTIPLDGVIHLAGENIAAGRWTSKRKLKIWQSRVDGTSLLVGSLKKLSHKPSFLVAASAIGFYGNSGKQPLDESAGPGSGFLADLCSKWEQATQQAIDSGIRVANIRLGMVLSEKGGALQKMLFPFKMGVGGILGSGQQEMNWVSIEDVMQMIYFIMENDKMDGPVNLVSPHPVTNSEFTKTLARVIKRPAVFRIPAFGIKMIFGEMAKELLLSGSRVIPQKLKTNGYPCLHIDLETYLKEILT